VDSRKLETRVATCSTSSSQYGRKTEWF